MSAYPKPATPLPWPKYRIRIARPDDDVAYAIHAANVFPHLVEALRLAAETIETDGYYTCTLNAIRKALAIARGETGDFAKGPERE